jgi:hypothetical protein
MKKVLTVLAMCAVLLLTISSATFAQSKDIIIRGSAVINYIVLPSSNPANDVPLTYCYVELQNFQDYKQAEVCDMYPCVPCRAFGTQINLALLKACNAKERISVTLKVMKLKPLVLEIIEVDFGDPQDDNGDEIPDEKYIMPLGSSLWPNGSPLTGPRPVWCE